MQAEDHDLMEHDAKGPLLPGECAPAVDIHVSVMMLWRPKRRWFETESQHLIASARCSRVVPELAELCKRTRRPRKVD